jgi:hypothetical protein
MMMHARCSSPAITHACPATSAGHAAVAFLQLCNCLLILAYNLLLLQVLSELIDLVASELGRQARELAAAAARSAEQEARLAGKADELAQLQNTLK